MLSAAVSLMQDHRSLQRTWGTDVRDRRTCFVSVKCRRSGPNPSSQDPARARSNAKASRRRIRRIRYRRRRVPFHVQRTLISASCLAAISALAGKAAAQEGARGGDSAIEEVVVTAQMREQNVQEIPLSITAISGDMLEARGQTNIREI